MMVYNTLALAQVLVATVPALAVAMEYSLLCLQSSFGALPAMGSGMGGNTMSGMVPPAEDELMY
eukprot:2090833-Ditylum_brightwellii.AAC.1